MKKQNVLKRLVIVLLLIPAVLIDVFIYGLLYVLPYYIITGELLNPYFTEKLLNIR